jgi:hypothetical protein
MYEQLPRESMQVVLEYLGMISHEGLFASQSRSPRDNAVGTRPFVVISAYNLITGATIS